MSTGNLQNNLVMFPWHYIADDRAAERESGLISDEIIGK